MLISHVLSWHPGDVVGGRPRGPRMPREYIIIFCRIIPTANTLSSINGIHNIIFFMPHQAPCLPSVLPRWLSSESGGYYYFLRRFFSTTHPLGLSARRPSNHDRLETVILFVWHLRGVGRGDRGRKNVSWAAREFTIRNRFNNSSAGGYDSNVTYWPGYEIIITVRIVLPIYYYYELDINYFRDQIAFSIYFFEFDSDYYYSSFVYF